MQFAGIILCGGRSTRLGQDKAGLTFGPTTMLEHAVERLRPTLIPLVVVAAESQTLPVLADDVIVVRDRRPDTGPLEGLAAGLAALQRQGPVHRQVSAAYLTGCDFPLLLPEFVQAVCDRLGDHQAAVPLVAGIRQTLASAVRIDVLSVVEQMLHEDQRRTNALFDRLDTVWIDEPALRQVDPQLISLRNVNTPEEYRAALTEAGYSSS